jgi:hypothetical protein
MDNIQWEAYSNLKYLQRLEQTRRETIKQSTHILAGIIKNNKGKTWIQSYYLPVVLNVLQNPTIRAKLKCNSLGVIP